MENTPVSIVVVQLLQLPGNGSHNTVSNSNSVAESHVYFAVAQQRLLSRCLEVFAINGSVCHNIMNIYINISTKYLL
jgi:hypothetical protein